jgi:transposase
MLADQLDYVIGVDTHKDVHALAVVSAPTGGVVCEAALPASAAGYREALRLAQAAGAGRRAFAIEGTGSYGAGLARFLASRGERVLEVGRLPREGRRSRAKTDSLDAIRAARSVLAQERVAQPRAGGRREELRALVVCREGALAAKRAGLCQLRDLLLCAPPTLREQLQTLSRARLLRRLAQLRLEQRKETAARGSLLALRLLARRLQALTLEERQLAREIKALVEQSAPQLLAEPGVGPVCAARVLLSFSHRGRIHSEAAFARLAGAAPIPASSGRTIRHRLDPGGDRQLNRALHTIVLSRRKSHPPTIAYLQRRTRQGKTTREATRCLKRYLARHLYRMLEKTATAA